MTKDVFIAKTDELINDITKQLKDHCVSLFNSGAIDASTYQDDFVLPKIIMAAALKNAVDWVMPLSKCYRDEVDNLRHF